MNIFWQFLTIVWFLLPAGIANMTAAVSGKIFPRFSLPLDLNYKFRGRRIFGAHKTVRGLVFGSICGLLTFYLQNQLIGYYEYFKKLSLSGFENNIPLGFALTLGALMGELFKSFVKRQLDISPGKSWFPFDQLDWILGSLLFSRFLINLNLEFTFFAIIVGSSLHLLTKIIGFSLHLQEKKT